MFLKKKPKQFKFSTAVSLIKITDSQTHVTQSKLFLDETGMVCLFHLLVEMFPMITLITWSRSNEKFYKWHTLLSAYHHLLSLFQMMLSAYRRPEMRTVGGLQNKTNLENWRHILSIHSCDRHFSLSTYNTQQFGVSTNVNATISR